MYLNIMNQRLKIPIEKVYPLQRSLGNKELKTMSIRSLEKMLHQGIFKLKNILQDRSINWLNTNNTFMFLESIHFISTSLMNQVVTSSVNKLWKDQLIQIWRIDNHLQSLITFTLEKMLKVKYLENWWRILLIGVLT